MNFHAPPESAHPLVRLRALTRADVQAWFDYLSLPEVHQHTSWDVHSVEELQTYVDVNAQAAPSSPVRFAIALRGSDELVGTAGFHTVSALNRSAEIAYDIAPDWWGRGIASAVCAELTGWAFAHVGLVRVQATALESNARSIGVLQRCGFEVEGLLRSYRMVRGQSGNFWMYAKLSPVPASAG